MSAALAPRGVTITAQPGDFMLTRRKGFVHTLIVLGERVRFRKARWSHAAFFVAPDLVVEALSRGVKYTALSDYEGVEYVIVNTAMDNWDRGQAAKFARSCVGQKYGLWTLLGIALRFLTPGRGLWFGMNGTEICSGLVAQALCRGWANFPVAPSTMTPAELANYYGVGRINEPH